MSDAQQCIRYYRVVKNGQGRKPTVETYTFYPDVPVGEMGRGPYCISWAPVLTAEVHEWVSYMKRRGYREIPEELLAGADVQL